MLCIKMDPSDKETLCNTSYHKIGVSGATKPLKRLRPLWGPWNLNLSSLKDSWHVIYQNQSQWYIPFHPEVLFTPPPTSCLNFIFLLTFKGPFLIGLGGGAWHTNLMIRCIAMSFPITRTDITIWNLGLALMLTFWACWVLCAHFLSLLSTTRAFHATAKCYAKKILRKMHA